MSDEVEEYFNPHTPYTLEVCPNCEKPLRFQIDLRRKKVACPHCGSTFSLDWSFLIERH